MTGFNMPPGCSVSDIPGNRLEDDRYEAFCEALEAAFNEHKPEAAVQELPDSFVEAVYKMLWQAHGDGYAQAQSDAAEAQRLEPFPEGPPSGT